MNIKDKNISSTADCIEYEQFIIWSNVTQADRKMYETSQYTQHANI
jgi:hypothetical protein